MNDEHSGANSSGTQPPFPCPACGGQFDGRVLIWETSDRGRAGIQRCPTCGLHITYPRLPEPQGEYLGTTLDGWQAKYGAIDRGERLHDRHANYLEETAIIRRYVPRGRIVDVGCNAGWLLGYLQRAGEYTLEGVEPSPILAKIARQRLGFPIHQSYLHEVRGREGAFDGLTATDVIEHVLPEDIHTFVGAVAGILKPGGYAFIKTPNAHFTALKYRLAGGLPEVGKRFMLRGRDMWDAKEHVIHWDAANLARVFAAHGLAAVEFVVPRPVETQNSPMGAVIARRVIYRAAKTIGGGRRIPSIAQDIFLVARKAL